MSSKVIFLDIDGVLNSQKWYISEKNVGDSKNTDYDLDPNCIFLINKLCEETNSKIVLSSDWRIDTGSFARLSRVGLINIIDKTPITIFGQYGPTYHFSRGEEIQMWLEWHPEVTKYVIIDDSEDFLKEQLQYFVKTDPNVGFTNENYKQALKILNDEQF